MSRSFVAARALISASPAPGPSALSPFRRVLDETWPQCEERLAKLAIGLGLRGEQAADVLQDVYVTAVQKPPPIAEEAAAGLLETYEHLAPSIKVMENNGLTLDKKGPEAGLLTYALRRGLVRRP